MNGFDKAPALAAVGQAASQPVGPQPAPVVAAPGIADARPAGDRRIAPPGVPANTPRLQIAAPPFALRPAPAGSGGGARLAPIPLAAFGWPGPAGRPRSRGDHVLIWRDPQARGAAELRLPGVTRSIPPGTAEWLPAGTAFAVSAPAAEGVVLLVPRAMADRSPAPLPAAPARGRPAVAERARLAAALSALGGATGTGPQAAIAALCHLGLIAVTLAQLPAHPGPQATACPKAGATPTPPPPPPAGMHDAARGLVARFTDLSVNEMDRGRTLADLAAELGTSAGVLDQACRQVRGQSAMDLIYALRRERALSLLREGRMTADRVARATGFSSLAHMSRIISAATGRGPQAFLGGTV